MGIWRTFPNSVTTEVDASLFMPLEGILPSTTPPRKGNPCGRHPSDNSTPRGRGRNRALDREARRSLLDPLHAGGQGGRRARHGVRDSRGAVRGGELRRRPGCGLGRSLGHARRMLREGAILPSAVKRPSGTCRRYRAPSPLGSAKAVTSEIGKLIEAAAYSVEVDPLVVLLGLDLANLRSEPCGPSREGFLVLVL